MMPADRQDFFVKAAIVAAGILVLGVVVFELYYEAAAGILSVVAAWLVATKTKMRHKHALFATGCVGLASVISTNRLVTHKIIVENETGAAISGSFLSWSTDQNAWSCSLPRLPDGEGYVVWFRSLLFDGNVSVHGQLADGSSFSGDSRSLDKRYRGQSRAVVRPDGKVEFHFD